MHFNNHTSSRGEKDYAKIKQKLYNSQSDLKIVITNANRACDRQRRKYVYELDIVK